MINKPLVIRKSICCAKQLIKYEIKIIKRGYHSRNSEATFISITAISNSGTNR